MLRVCDAIMGSGKTSATINYINAHPEKKFLYITPYLPEAKRIRMACPGAHFAEPSKKIPKCAYSKSMHALELIQAGRNIASTHQALAYFTEETFQKLKEMGYCVIIDEEVNILQKATGIKYGDVKLALEAGLIYEASPGEYRRTEKQYKGGVFSNMLRVMSSRPLICVKEMEGRTARESTELWYWVFSEGLFKYVDDIILLTYMFEGSEMEMFLKRLDIEYRFIGIRRSQEGCYAFSDEPEYIPEYTKRLNDLIHIESGEKINAVGDNRTSLSMNWYNTHNADLDQLRKNLYNYFRHKVKCTGKDRMCGTYKAHWEKIKDKGFESCGVVFCERSKNEYRERWVLAYPVNLFVNTTIKNYYRKQGLELSDEHFALSTMLQWIWRSAIRDGKEIYIYIPSRRMRGLLENWIEEVSKLDNV